jgi:hypothetical protein
MSLQSIPKRAIVSIQPDPMGPYEFMDIDDAEEMLNSRHVGGANMMLVNVCASSPASCMAGILGGKRSKRRLSRKTKRFIRNSKTKRKTRRAL